MTYSTGQSWGLHESAFIKCCLPGATPSTRSVLVVAAVITILFKNIYLFEAEREEEAERIPSRLHAVSTEPHVGLDLANRDVMT